MPYKCDKYCNEKNSISISYNKKITAIFRTILTLLSLKIAEQMIQVLVVSMSSRIHPSSFK